MTTDILRMGRADLLARIAELEAENARLTKDHGTMLETLTHAQAAGTRLLDQARGVRHFLNDKAGEPFTDALHAIMGAAWAAEVKHGAFHPRLSGIPDAREVETLPGVFDLASVSSILADVRAACTKAEQDGTVSWSLLALEEMLEALVEALRRDPVKLRAEVAQLGCICAAWIAAIDLRASAKEDT